MRRFSSCLIREIIVELIIDGGLLKIEAIYMKYWQRKLVLEIGCPKTSGVQSE